MSTKTNSKLAGNVSNSFGPIIQTMDKLNSTMKDLADTFSKQHPKIQREFCKLGRKFGDVVKASHEFVYKTKGTILANKMTMQNISLLVNEPEPEKEDLMEAVDDIKKLVVKLDEVVAGSKSLTGVFESFDKEAQKLQGNIAIVAEEVEKELQQQAQLQQKAKQAMADAERAKKEAQQNSGWALVWNVVKVGAKMVCHALVNVAISYVAVQLSGYAANITLFTGGLVNGGELLMNFTGMLHDMASNALDTVFDAPPQETQMVQQVQSHKVKESTLLCMKEQTEKSKGAVTGLSSSAQQSIMALKQFLNSEAGIKQLSQMVQGVTPDDRIRDILQKLKAMHVGLMDTQTSITVSLEAFEVSVRKCCNVYFDTIYPLFVHE